MAGLLATVLHTTWMADVTFNDQVSGALTTGPKQFQLSNDQRRLADLPPLTSSAPTSADGEGAFLPCYDGNGNILAYYDASTGTAAATQTYGPFGEIHSRTGLGSTVLPHRWSTKPDEERAGLSYYGYRYYSAGLGSWLSRDPAGEKYGPNNFASCENDPLLEIDVLGLHQFILTSVRTENAGELHDPEKPSSIVFGLTKASYSVKCWMKEFVAEVSLDISISSLEEIRRRRPNSNIVRIRESAIKSEADHQTDFRTWYEGRGWRRFVDFIKSHPCCSDGTLRSLDDLMRSEVSYVSGMSKAFWDNGAHTSDSKTGELPNMYSEDYIASYREKFQ